MSRQRTLDSAKKPYARSGNRARGVNRFRVNFFAPRVSRSQSRWGTSEDPGGGAAGRCMPQAGVFQVQLALDPAAGVVVDLAPCIDLRDAGPLGLDELKLQIAGSSGGLAGIKRFIQTGSTIDPAAPKAP
jgi:hypothetical protein